MIGQGWGPALARVLAALLVTLAGMVHLELWREGYRGIPYIGPLFLANVVASGVVAARLLLGGGRPTAVAGMLISIGSLTGLALTRTVGLFGFMESGWTSAASRAVSAELGAVVSLALVLALTARSLPEVVKSADTSAWCKADEK